MKENIEEDIKIVQEFLIEQNKRKQRLIDNPYRQLFYTDEELQAIDHVISNYKRVLKENEEWKKAYQEEKDKQFDLLRENQKLNEYIILAPNLDEMTAMKYRNITEEAYIKGRAEEQQKAEQIIYEHYISKQKIKDKIEELNKKEKQELKGTKGQDRYSIKQQYMYQRNVLQELLEEKGE